MITRFYSFHKTTSYETLFQDKRVEPRVLRTWKKPDYDKLLELSEKVAHMAASMHELRCVHEGSPDGLNELEDSLDSLFQKMLADNGANLPHLIHLSEEDKREIQNLHALLKQSLNSSKGVDNCGSGLNIATNTITSLIAASGFALAVLFAMSWSIGPILLGVAIALVSLYLAVSAIHSIYIDARFLADQQLKEINELINTLVKPTEDFPPPPAYEEETPPAFSSANV